MHAGELVERPHLEALVRAVQLRQRQPRALPVIEKGVVEVEEHGPAHARHPNAVARGGRPSLAPDGDRRPGVAARRLSNGADCW